jgi:hypothetical protein
VTELYESIVVLDCCVNKSAVITAEARFCNLSATTRDAFDFFG